MMVKEAEMSTTGTQPLVEGEDFYWDREGYMVFTAKYLLKRGYCCHQGCRHCPYEDEDNAEESK